MSETGWWCWCLKGRAAHYHEYLPDGTSKITYPRWKDERANSEHQAEAQDRA